jgi:2-oxo-3-hexenedioate decarboxylase
MVPKTNFIKQAEYLLNGERERRELKCLSEVFGPLTLDEAYAIQLAGLELRASSNVKLSGWKMGLTSIAKRKQMSLDSAIFGYLLGQKAISGDSFNISALIHPKVEPELGFRLKKRVDRVLSFDEALKAIDTICPALEIIDSRYVGFKYFSLPDVIADNCSASHYKWGAELPFDPQKNWESLQMDLFINGEKKESALSAEISGNPINSLVQLSEMLASKKLVAEAGALVLAGAATNAVALHKGDQVELQVSGLKSLKLGIQG